MVDRVIRRRDPDVAGGLVAKLAQCVDLSVDFLEVWGDPSEKPLASLGRRHGSRRAAQKPDAEPRFELTDGVAECGLRNAYLGCGLGEAAFSGDLQKGLQVIEVFARHS